MTKTYLTWVGWILVVLGILGFVWAGIPGTLALTASENYAHLVLGIVALLAVYWGGAQLQKWLTAVFGIVALYFGIWGFVDPTYYNITSLELLDNVIHIVLGAWGLWAVWGKQG